MNKEEFQTKKNDINSKIRKLKSQKIKLEKEYIKSNAKYPIGSKVCITTPASTYIRLDNHESVVIPEKNNTPILRVIILVFMIPLTHCLARSRKMVPCRM
jgi:hypothetical protein